MSEQECDHDHAHGNAPAEPIGLTRNETLVWEALCRTEIPMKAYEILDHLKEKGVRAPMTVYRALDGLEEKGYVHKLEGLNSFVRCSHGGPHMVQAFMVCEKCSYAKEIMLNEADSGILAAVKHHVFEMQTAQIEINGVCRKCFLNRQN